MNTRVAHAYLSKHGSVALWYGFFGPPVVWFLELLFSYPLVPYACWSGNAWTLYTLNVLGLLLIIGAGVVNYSLLMQTGAELPADHATRTDRTRMMAAIGLMFSGLFLLILIGHLVSTAVVGPCIPEPREPLSPDTYLAPSTERLLVSMDVESNRC